MIDVVNKTKNSRVNVLTVELEAADRELKRKLRDLEEAHRKKVNNLTFTTTTAVAKHGRERDVKIAAARMQRDKSLQEAEKARAIALRQVQSDYDSAVNAFKKSFENERDTLDAETTTKTSPLREEFLKNEFALKELFEDQAKLLVEAATKELEPIVAELQALKAKIDAAQPPAAPNKIETSTLPDESPKLSKKKKEAKVGDSTTVVYEGKTKDGKDKLKSTSQP